MWLVKISKGSFSFAVQIGFYALFCIVYFRLLLKKLKVKENRPVKRKKKPSLQVKAYCRFLLGQLNVISGIFCCGRQNLKT